MKYTVNFSQLVSVTVTVDANNTESAIEAAYDEAPDSNSICARCSGWGQNWGRDDAGELLVESVSDESGDAVYTEPETWQRVPLIPMEG